MVVQRSNSKFGDGRVRCEIHDDCQERIAGLVIGSAEETTVVCLAGRAAVEQAYRHAGFRPVFSSTKENWTLAVHRLASGKTLDVRG